jgi:exopolysaccharide biosynthesis polyprenyl glycosylphosphotransferase
MSVPSFRPEGFPRPSLRKPPPKKLQSLALDSVAQTFPVSFNLSGWQSRAATRRIERGRGCNVLIVGAGPLGRKMADTLKRQQIDGRVVVGFLDETENLTGDVLGRVENLAQVARAEFVDEIILAIPEQRDLATQAIREARRNRLNIRVIPDLFNCEWEEQSRASRRLGLEYFGDLPVLTLHQEKAPTSRLFWKRVLDVMVSGLALFVAAPVMAMIALAIKLASPGKVLYQAKRVGLKGRRFACYKFRTMVADADRLKDSLRPANERNGPCFKIAADPRITPVGRFLRRYSLDELPQLWNVLRGEMSMVGPRPHPLDDFEHYRLDHLRRLDVTPGITGLWQVTARRDPSFQRNMALDLEYIEQWSLAMDLRILWKTVFVVLQGSGA